MSLISETIVGGGGAANITFSAIPGTFRHLQIFWVGRSDQAGAQAIKMQFNADTAGNYDYQDLLTNHTTVAGAASVAQTKMRCGAIPGTGAPADAMGGGTITIPYYATTTEDKLFTAQSWRSDGTAQGNQNMDFNAGAWRTSGSAITQVVIVPDAGNFVANSSFSLYGIT